MEANIHRPTWKTLLAYAIIYLVWGTTFLAIRIGVREVPPFLLAGIRFLVAGGVLFGWMIARGERSPTLRQWASASLIAILIFALGAVRNSLPENAGAHGPSGPGALGWNRRCGRAHEPIV